ncbi:ulp1 [Haematobia irritans]|uniref:ulp1 n=1 Tax=Haematobia irritans TaxID=7368 RepID=UPI003F4FDB93
MMYIEHTGLEDNLHHILTNRVPTSRYQDIDQKEAEPSSSNLRGGRATLPRSQQLSTEGVNEQHQKSSKDWVRRPEPKLVPVESLKSLDGSNHLPYAIPKEALNGALESLTKNKEDEEEKFELLYVEDVDDKEPEAGTSNFRSGLEGESQPEEKSVDRSTTHFVIDIDKVSGSGVAATDNEDEEYEYVVTRVPKRKSIRQSPQYQEINQYPSTAPIPPKTKRPVPEAIPLELHQRKLLNGSFSFADVGTSSPREKSAANGLKNLGNYNYYSDLETGKAISERDCDKELFEKDVQMGLDILSKIRQIFTWNSSSHQLDTENQEGKRKRRSEDYTGESASDHLIKYRKVENRFPKYVSQTEDDEIMQFKPPAPQNTNSFLPHNMTSTRRSGIDKPVLRKSMFSAPHVTKQVIKNTSYADIEFSDDDDVQLVYPSTSGAVRRTSKTFNIPIVRSDERATSLSQKPPPPPLIEPRTGSIVSSSNFPDVEPERKLTYADALRQSNARVSVSGRQGNVLGVRNNSVSSSGGASTSESSHLMNGFSSLRTNPWSSFARSSVLAQEKQCEERQQYQKLLEQVMPRLYSSSNENKLPTVTQRRRSGLMLAAATSSARSSPANNRRSLGLNQSLLKRPPLSSTINLDDDDDDDILFNGISEIKPTPRLTKIKPNQQVATVVVDDDISDIVDLESADKHVLSQCAKIKQEENILNSITTEKPVAPKKELPYVEPVNSFKERISSYPHLKENWLQNLQSKWSLHKKNRLVEVNETAKVAEKLASERRAAEAEIQERLRKFQIVDPELLVVDDFADLVPEPEFVELTPQHVDRINAAIRGPPDQVLVSKFNLNITRRDIHTLCGHNWLNDEVINFYMNLLTERGEVKSKSHGLPTVYAMNTFFVPRLIQAGHAGVKRWTRKVDIFSKDILPVPVHVGGVHWCMAIIHMKNRTIKYYDSMGTPNPTVLKALEQYLKDESMDKRKQPFDTSNFLIESVQGVPRQMNGSDCGVFSCMFAEYITRNKEITFSQQNMEYFRQKMVLEIVSGELLQ